ncbi:hypothetical protein RFI_39655 [Reticulomyxa filosa]|uniref:Uncharacterized protein n=1 Tax=Reticulomyxa filosa TaxID=46433 RepID=X6L978_RETFI|nr:hypothetical protein RFI_39655 [Reticulomyxa filosa]|eukprot:ETN97870.1 hypothetical protein RFI_39655 [Reticulomyxa filosa]
MLLFFSLKNQTLFNLLLFTGVQRSNVKFIKKGGKKLLEKKDGKGEKIVGEKGGKVGKMKKIKEKKKKRQVKNEKEKKKMTIGKKRKKMKIGKKRRKIEKGREIEKKKGILSQDVE